MNPTCEPEALRSRSTVCPVILRAVVFVAALSALLSIHREARAYPWMIRHDYVGCGMCHADPSGAGLLTRYGQDQGENLLRTAYRSSENDGEEPSPWGGFLLGFVTPPEWLLAGGSFRLMELFTKIDGASTTNALILMQADVRAAIRAGHWRAAASAGAVTSEGSAASLAGSFVSRQHWIGYSFDDDAVLLRAGRIDLPFGIRSVEHTLFVRSATRTDLNDTQQHGVAFAYSGETLRGEVMGIVGNFQVSPDAYRERGYSGYFEWGPHPRAALGVSSLATHVATDLYLHVANTRQAHGLFGRVAPWRPLVLLLEGDAVLQRPEGGPSRNGYATMVQADIEPLQGLHLVTTGETYRPGGPGVSMSYSGWFGVNWFFAPHADVRIDVMARHLGGPIDLNVTAYMGQLHIYL